MNSYISLGIAAALPVVLAAATYLLRKKTRFGKWNVWVQQAIIGVLFGALAIVGTEWGIPMNGAQVNCRDAAVLIAGLFFGAPAGIIAGVIGGVERFIAVYWGVGAFTRIACSVSTVIAGVYAALLRRFMFANKRPGWLLAFAVGLVMETFHLTMVFLTNMSDAAKAMAVVQTCTAPMLIANGLSVMAAAVVISLIARERLFVSRHARVHISQTIQRWLLVAVALAFAATTLFVFNLQDQIALRQTETLLKTANGEVAADIRDTSDLNMLAIARQVAKEIASSPDMSLSELAEQYDLAEINVVNNQGYISMSSTVGKTFFMGDPESDKPEPGKEQAWEFVDRILRKKEEEMVQEYGPISEDPSVFRKYAAVRTPNGFVQIGYDAEQLQAGIDSAIVGITRNRHVGETGYVLIFDSEHHAVSAPRSLQDKDMQIDVSSMLAAAEGAVFRFTITYEEPGYTESNAETGETVAVPAQTVREECFCQYEETEGYDIVALLPVGEALRMRNVTVYVNVFMEILAFAILFAMIYELIKIVVVNQIQRVNRSLSKITEGNLSEVVDVRQNVEFASLSDDINSTVDTLKHYIDEAAARIDKELEFAKNIQSSALPDPSLLFSRRRDFSVFASMDPAKEVGGDFYDAYLTGNRLNFMVADVSGKGIPAAMFMMRAKTELKSLTEAGLPLCEVFTHGNEALCEGNDAGMFVTSWQGGIDLDTGLVQFANAGHNPPLVRRGNGKFEYLKGKCGFVLAGMDGVCYKTQELQLAPGDVLYLYTDGVTEATNAENELYGEARLLAAANAKEFESVEEMCRYIRKDVDGFVGEAPQFDDMTMLALQFFGTPPSPSVFREKATLADIPEVTAFVEEELEKWDLSPKVVIQFSIAIDEIYSNIVNYGYPQEKPGPVKVEVLRDETAGTVGLRFTDSGIPYNPVTKEDPDVTLSAEERKIGGLGIFMVKKSMDDMHYEYRNDQNILTITKKI